MHTIFLSLEFRKNIFKKENGLEVTTKRRHWWDAGQREHMADSHPDSQGGEQRLQGGWPGIGTLLSPALWTTVSHQLSIFMMCCTGFRQAMGGGLPTSIPSYFKILRPLGRRYSSKYSWTSRRHMMPWIGTGALRVFRHNRSYLGQSKYFGHTETGWTWWPGPANTLASLSNVAIEWHKDTPVPHALQRGRVRHNPPLVDDSGGNQWGQEGSWSVDTGPGSIF